MASAGKILITPKGNWNAETEYEILDLVFHEGTSWLSKKEVVGIEPSVDYSEFWFKLCESVDLTEIYNRIQALESQMLSTISLDDIDLSEYAKKTELSSYALKTDLNSINSSLTSLDSRLDTAEPKITNLTTDLNTLKTNVASLGSLGSVQIASGYYAGTGANNKTITAPFPPKFLAINGSSNSSTNVTRAIITIGGGKAYGNASFGPDNYKIGRLTITTSGNNVTLQHTDTQAMATLFVCNDTNSTYTWIAIG